ncbi:hypothetical protein [Simiduia agarivorans]|uniref:Uncharacterized protein n=1 Tax=Simiduia agarivorans (strain DSM 21679 / JCM 13881 / BCRC 17597 / SA1) TaxID=1117647 RepID=K4KFB1_SIMAS|nr:hypothetical protein [Simiduia agarivorans]AFU97744.1 hypothetical protein M5M_02635 [Simiduia agarivorans SA1 = DSM 21679]
MTRKVNLVLWIGSGSVTRDDVCIEASESILLVDSNEAFCNTLTKRFGNEERVKVLHALVGFDDRECDWYEYNLSQLSSTSPATSKLLQLYPGLKLVQTKKVSALPIRRLLEIEGIGSGNNRLVLDFISGSCEVLESLFDAPKVRFSEIYVLSARSNVYETMQTGEELEGLMMRNGYELIGCISKDPDFPLYKFKSSALWTRLQNAEERYSTFLTEAQLKSNEYEKEIDYLRLTISNLSEEKKDYEKKLERTTSDLEKSRTVTRSEMERLESEAKNARDAAEEFQAKCKELAKELENKVSLLSEHSKWNSGLKSEIKSLNEKLSKSQANSELLESRLEEVNAKVEEKNYRNSKLELEIASLEGQVDFIKDLIIREKVF